MAGKAYTIFMKQLNPRLSSEQKAVLFDKATEAPCTGKLLHVTDDGLYICATATRGNLMRMQSTILAVAGLVLTVL